MKDIHSLCAHWKSLYWHSQANTKPTWSVWPTIGESPHIFFLRSWVLAAHRFTSFSFSIRRLCLGAWELLLKCTSLHLVFKLGAWGGAGRNFCMTMWTKPHQLKWSLQTVFIRNLMPAYANYLYLSVHTGPKPAVFVGFVVANGGRRCRCCLFIPRIANHAFLPSYFC